jgi:hypothetical protein
MQRAGFLVLFFLVKGHIIFSQVPMDTMIIQQELSAIYDRDQKTRVNGDSIEFVDFIDSCNLAQVEKLIATYGWMGKSTIGPNANYTLFLVIQHADLETQEKYYPLMEESVNEGESRPVDLAMLEDRILMRQGKKQIYGSQVVFNKVTGDQEFYPIEDEKHVNIRRAKVGMVPLEEYAIYFGIDYKLPTE